MENGKIYAISVSEERGTLKREVEECIVTPQGLEGDGHAGDWSRQITCLRYESLAASNAKHGLQMGPGDMAENILIEGLDFAPVKAGTKIRLGEEAVIEVSQIGKPDHPSIVTKDFRHLTAAKGRAFLPCRHTGKNRKRRCGIRCRIDRFP